MAAFNIRQYYKDTIAKKEKDLSDSTGLKIRHEFQPYNSGTKDEDVFFVRTTDRECYGMEFGKAIFYFSPLDNSSMVIFIFDSSLVEFVKTLINMPNERLEVFGKYIPSIIAGARNAAKGIFYDYCFYLDENQVCIAKRIDYSLLEKLENGYWAEPELIHDFVALINYRNRCVEEITSFPGFSDSDEREILLKKGLNFIEEHIDIPQLFEFFASLN